MTDKVRIDKWLWAARFFRTRALARDAIKGGKVQIEGVRVKPGRTLFELSFPDDAQAREALSKAIQKLPIKARIITREEAI